MAEFDPDAYLTAAPAFDPDAYLKQPAAAAALPPVAVPKTGEFQQRQHTYRGAIRAGSSELPAGAGADVEPRPELRHDFGKTLKGMAKGVPAAVAGGVLGDVEELGRHGINWAAGSEAVSPKTAIPTTVEGGLIGDRGAGILPPATSEDERGGMTIGSMFAGPPIGALYKGARAGARAINARMPRPLSAPDVPSPPAAVAAPQPTLQTRNFMTGKPSPEPGVSDLPMTPAGSPVAVPREGSGARLLPADVPHVETAGTLEDALAGRRSAGAAGVSPLEEFSPETIAHMRKTLEQENVTPWTMEQRLEEMSPQQSLAEFSPNTEAHAGATASPPGAGKNEIINFFKQRAAETKERMRHTLDQTFGPAEDLAQRTRVINIDQNIEASPLYRRFRSMEVPPSPELDALMPRLQAADAFGVARHKAALEGRPFEAEWFTPEQRTAPTAQSWDYVKRALDEKIAGSYNPATHRATDYTRIYKNLKDDLLAAFDHHPNEEIADVWRQARQAWGEPEAIKNAQNLGRKLLTKAIDKDEFRFETAGYSQAEMAGLRQGLRSELENSLGHPGKTELPVMKQILGENNQQKMRWVIGDEATDALTRSVEHEFNMHGAPTRIHGNSPTALRQEANKSWTPQPGLFDAKDLMAVTHGLTGAALHAAKKTFMAKSVARQEAKFAQLRDEAARIYTMQGPERDAVLRYLLTPPPKASGGRVTKRAEGGKVGPKLDYNIDSFPKIDRHELRGSVPIGNNTELTGRAYAYPETNRAGFPMSPGGDWGATIGVRKGFDDGGSISSWVDGVPDQDDAGQSEAARGVAARGVARGVQHHVPLGLLPPEGSGVAPPEAFPQKTWMMEPDLLAQQSGNLDLPPGAKLDDANRPFYPDTGRQIEMIKRPGLLPLAKTPDGPQFVMPKLLDLASNVMSPLAAGRVPVKAGEMVLGSGPVRTKPEAAENIVSLGARREQKELEGFHGEMMSEVGKRAQERMQVGAEYHEAGKLPMPVGTRFTTNHSREQQLLPWEVTGHYVDPKNPEKYGYYAQRGQEGEEGWERATVLANDPKRPEIAKLAEQFTPMGGPRAVGAVPDTKNLIKGSGHEGQPADEAAATAAQAPPEASVRGPGGDFGLAEAQAAATRAAGSARPIEDLPQAAISIPTPAGDISYIPGPIERVHQVAEDYMRSTGRKYEPITAYRPVDEKRAARIAEQYERMPHAPDDPKVIASYDAMIKETMDQLDHIQKSGLKIEFIKPGMKDPYETSPRLATMDVRDNNHLWVYPTETGFGTAGSPGSAEALKKNPLLADTGVEIGGHKLLANDAFRIVHDYFGHIKDGVGFRAGGEENAWRSHSRMYSPLARGAMTAETRGQNSWVNYGPHGGKNRTAKSSDTVYADQKTGLLPQWVERDGAQDHFARPDAKVINAGVDAPTNKSAQTVADAHRMMYPGIYENPKRIAREAAERVAPEDLDMKRLWGVSRGDLDEMAKGRKGNRDPDIFQGPGVARGSLSAQNIQTPKNTQRIQDILAEAGKHRGLKHADAWYILDPVYQHMEKMFGPELAKQKFERLNTLMGMSSPGSEVLTEIQRGTAANMKVQQGKFNEFLKHAGTEKKFRGADFPEDLRNVEAHPYHRTSQAEPMQKYLETGKIQSKEAKVPAYVQASSVPEVGFQTRGPVADSHFSRGVGLADTRKGPTDVASSASRPEYHTLQPWWENEVAGNMGLESVPAQARLWTALGPRTGVTSMLGQGKLELLTKQIMATSKRLRIPPEEARDLVLSGKAYAGRKDGGAVKKKAKRAVVETAQQLAARAATRRAMHAD